MLNSGLDFYYKGGAVVFFRGFFGEIMGGFRSITGTGDDSRDIFIRERFGFGIIGDTIGAEDDLIAFFKGYDAGLFDISDGTTERIIEDVAGTFVDSDLFGFSFTNKIDARIAD